MFSDERLQTLNAQRDAHAAAEQAKAAAQQAAIDARIARAQGANDAAQVAATRRAAVQAEVRQVALAKRIQAENDRRAAARSLGVRVARNHLDYAALTRVVTQGVPQSATDFEDVVPAFFARDEVVWETLRGGVKSRDEALAFVAGVEEVIRALPK